MECMAVTGYGMTPDTLKTRDQQLLAYHRIVEAFKFAYAKRTDLGDANFVNVTEIVRNLTSRAYADTIRSEIWDNTTHGTFYYGPTFYDRLTTSTAHLSVLGNDSLAVSVTTTVNLRFGSGVMGHRTGILFNDEMDDFSTPNITNAFGIPPSPANFIKPGKRPLSSMCPMVMVDKTGVVKMVVGAAGGSRITTSTAFVASKVLLFGDNIKQAIDFPRLHHQLLPPVLQYETNFPKYFVEGLAGKGHNMSEVSPGSSIVNGIVRVGNRLEANDDYRRPGGHPAGF
ncbi:hypothetical protein FSP39_018203 [Pinctada imbricata]|uniref:Gamma-glutamyltranspeptidase 1 n=1 Tax=Pinctada imbricata TaxID=66713 RepID=A0AA88YWC4_PINIB|nr:hypothetical protein FSP39_018203 [Pinctada imbricata]